VRAIHTGWGPDIPVLLTRDLRSSQKPMPSVIRAVRWSVALCRLWANRPAFRPATMTGF